MSVMLTKAERETIASFNLEDDAMTLDTFNKKHAHRLIEAGAIIMREGARAGVRYWSLKMPRSWFRWPRPPRALTPEQATRQAEHLRAAREKAPRRAPAPPSEAIPTLDLPMPVAVRRASQSDR